MILNFFGYIKNPNLHLSFCLFIFLKFILFCSPHLRLYWDIEYLPFLCSHLILQSECRAVIAFGLNALNGKSLMSSGSEGSWDSSNARDFIQYTVDHGHKIKAWELGKLLFSSNLMLSGRF